MERRTRATRHDDRSALRPDRCSGKSLWSDTRGVYQTEYTIVLVLVALMGILAIASLSVPLVQYHKSIQTMIVSPVP